MVKKKAAISCHSTEGVGANATNTHTHTHTHETGPQPGAAHIPLRTQPCSEVCSACTPLRWYHQPGGPSSLADLELNRNVSSRPDNSRWLHVQADSDALSR